MSAQPILRFLAVLLLTCIVPRASIAAQAGQKTSTLYVLSSSPKDLYAEILIIDPSAGTVLRTIQVGFSADMAVSPDGSKIYVSSNTADATTGDRKCFLETYDASSGKLMDRVVNPDGQQFSMPIHSTAMALSPSGNWLYIENAKTLNAVTTFYIVAFDTIKQKFSPVHIPLFGCKSPIIIPSAQDPEFSALCLSSTYLRVIKGNNSSLDRFSSSSIPFPEAFAKSTLTAVIPKEKPGSFAIWSRRGDSLSLDATNGESSIAMGTALHAEQVLPLQVAAVAATRQLAYFGFASTVTDFDEPFDQIVSVDITSGLSAHAVQPVDPFYKLALSKDEQTIFLVSPTAALVRALDSSTMKTTNSIPLPGKIPINVICR